MQISVLTSTIRIELILTLIPRNESPLLFVAYNPGCAKRVSAEHTLSKRPIANGGAAVKT